MCAVLLDRCCVAGSDLVWFGWTLGPLGLPVPDGVSVAHPITCSVLSLLVCVSELNIRLKGKRCHYLWLIVYYSIINNSLFLIFA